MKRRYGKILPSIARIARTVRKVYLRAYCAVAIVLLSPAKEALPTATVSTDRLVMRTFAGLSPCRQWPRSVRAVLLRLNGAACLGHPSSEASRLLSSSENRLERVVPSALAILSAATMEGVLSALSTAPT
jgi:hypothetical protein